MRERRVFRAKFKAQVVLEVLRGVKTGSEICRQHKPNPNLLSRWKQEFVSQASRVFEGEKQSQQEVGRIAELERLCGPLRLELAVAKKALQLSPSVQNRSFA